ncbi:MAG: hypothetical protein JNM93_01610 [Bacteriovoracaceae bacterium]|nr:hypothetical protein [Bacteriovoracaceae bacterium]
MNFLYLLLYHSLALAQFYDQPSKDRYDRCISIVDKAMSDSAAEKNYGEKSQGRCTLYYCEISGHHLGKSIYVWGQYRSCPSLKRLKAYTTKKKQSTDEEVTAFLNRFRETVEVKKEEVLIPPPEHKEEVALPVPTELKVMESKPNEAVVSQDYNKDTLTCSPENVDTHKGEEYVDLSEGVDDVDDWEEEKETSQERSIRRSRRERIIINDYDDYSDFYWDRSRQNNSCYNYCFQNQWQNQNQYWQRPYYPSYYNPYQSYFNPYLQLNLGFGFNNYPMMPMNRYPAYWGP